MLIGHRTINVSREDRSSFVDWTLLYNDPCYFMQAAIMMGFDIQGDFWAVLPFHLVTTCNGVESRKKMKEMVLWRYFIICVPR